MEDVSGETLPARAGRPLPQLHALLMEPRKRTGFSHTWRKQGLGGREVVGEELLLDEPPLVDWIDVVGSMESLAMGHRGT